MSGTAIPVTRDVNAQQAIPSEWRDTFRIICDAFVLGDVRVHNCAHEVKWPADEDEKIIAYNIEGYGLPLAPLSSETWKTSVCLWMEGYWDVLVDLYVGDGEASDLVLFAKVFPNNGTFKFEVGLVYVP